MTNSIHSTIISKLDETHDDVPAGYVMVNVRPGEKVAAMIDVLCKLSGMTPSALISDEIPRRLAAEVLLEENKGALYYIIEEIVGDDHSQEVKFAPYQYQYRYQEGSALYILTKEGKIPPVEVEPEIVKLHREIESFHDFDEAE